MRQPTAKQTATPYSEYELDRIWLRFRDPQTERTFERELLQSSIGTIRIYVFAGTMLFASSAARLDRGRQNIPRPSLIRFTLGTPVL